MAKADMTIQINITAPGLEAAIRGLTEAVAGIHGGELVVPAGSAVKVEEIMPEPVAAEEAKPEVAQEATVAQETATQTPAQATIVPAQAPATTPAPVVEEKQITLDDICNAGAKLVEQGMMAQVINLLAKYGVQAVNQIKPEQYASFAEDLRALGAQI